MPDVDEDGNDVEAPARKRAAKRKEEIMAYKSAQFIEDSDDDEEADAAFFAREQAVSTWKETSSDDLDRVLTFDMIPAASRTNGEWNSTRTHNFSVI